LICGATGSRREIEERVVDFIALGRMEVRRVLIRDMVSFKQKARSREMIKADTEMCIL
jgi:hypothetical protein